MWIQNPAELMAMSDEQMDEFRMPWQKSRMEFALANALAVPSDDDTQEAVDYITDACEIALTNEQMLAIYSLYPIERGKFADYGWGDTEIREQTLDILAHFFLSTRWPMGVDDVDIDRFVTRLKKVAAYMGYRISD